VAHHDGVPFAAVLGDREAATDTLALRARGEKWSAATADAIDELVRRCRSC
jgi:hypothetical protein